MSERAQALEAIRERLRNFETIKRAMDKIGNTPLATIRYIEDVTTLLDLLEAPAEGVSPQPDKLPTTLELSGTMPDIAHSRNCQCAECAPVSPVEPTPEPPRTTITWGDADTTIAALVAERDAAQQEIKALREALEAKVAEWREEERDATASGEPDAWERATVWESCADALNAALTPHPQEPQP